MRRKLKTAIGVVHALHGWQQEANHKRYAPPDPDDPTSKGGRVSGRGYEESKMDWNRRKRQAAPNDREANAKQSKSVLAA